MSSRNSVRLVGSSLAAAALVGAVWAGSADARTGAAGSTPTRVASTAPAASQLHDVAAALDEQGRGAHAATFTGLALQQGRVHLWATSLPAARVILADAHRAHPRLAMVLVDISVGRWSRSRLDAKASSLITSATARSLGVQSVAVRVDGSGLQVTLLATHPGTRRATNLPAALATLTKLAGVPVTGTIGGAITAA